MVAPPLKPGSTDGLIPVSAHLSACKSAQHVPDSTHGWVPHPANEPPDEGSSKAREAAVTGEEDLHVGISHSLLGLKKLLLFRLLLKKTRVVVVVSVGGGMGKVAMHAVP